MKKLSLLFISIIISIITTNAQWQLIDDNVAGGTAKQTQIEIAQDGTVYVSYQKHNGSTYDLRVKKYDGTTWTEITNEPLAAGSYDNSLRISEDGTLYILFVDEEISSGNGTGKASCMKYLGGTNWEYVGERGFSPADINMPDLCFDSEGNPYAGFKERDADYNGGLYAVSVMKFDGQDWKIVGERGIVSCWCGCALRLDNNNVPYIASAEGTSDDNNTLRIFKYDGENWIEPAAGAQSEQTVFGINIRFNSENVPHVAFTEFEEGGTDDKATVKFWTGVAWEKIGHPISEAAGYYSRIEFDNQDNLYMSYQDYAFGPAPLSVKIWDGNTWEYVGELGTVNNRAEYADLALDQNQQPWVSYSNVFTNYLVSVYQYVNPETTHTVYFNIAGGLEPEITLEGFSTQIATGGTATFSNIPETPEPGIPYTIELEGYETINDNIIVDGTELVNINLISTNISENQNNQISIYPNPSNGTFTITNYELKITNIEIIDITGKIIHKSEFSIFNFQFSIQKKGIYFIKIQTENQIFTEKLIIQ